jgi:prevent-host-death family protein
MELSIREAKARFSEAAAAAARGERVIVTKQGQPFIELVPAKKRGGVDWEKLALIRKELGVEASKVPDWPEQFDDPAFSRKVLGLEE